MGQSARLTDATFAFIDVETTGLSPSSDAVVEVACLVTCAGREVEAFSTLVNPGRPIPPPASAVHGIMDADVIGAPPLAQVVPKLRTLCESAVIVAHNARFDLGFLPHLADRPTICSMRLAQMLLPEAPNHKNQGLRQYLGVSDPRLSGTAAHRALADVIVTHLIFRECLNRHLAAGGADDVAALITQLGQTRSSRNFTFGRYRGQSIDSVPTDYLTWLTSNANSISDDTKQMARMELERRAALQT